MLRIKPKSTLENLSLTDDQVVYSVDMVDHLNGDTVASHTYKVYDSEDVDVTANFGGDSSESSGVLTLGLIAYATGTYTLRVVITCVELLPDGSTPRTYPFELVVTIDG